MLACPGFPADDDEEEEEEEVVHLLLYIPYLYYSGSVVCIRFKVYRYRTKPKPSLKAPKLHVPTYLPGAVIKLCCTPLHSNLQSTSQKSSRESHISYSALKVTLLNKYIET